MSKTHLELGYSGAQAIETVSDGFHEFFLLLVWSIQMRGVASWDAPAITV
ncbi:MAG TPA: hypothetical protein VKY56_07655 [Chloroflexota bacterium]|nr:hypothetical protein [Chloroflexota bacterium]